MGIGLARHLKRRFARCQKFPAGRWCRSPRLLRQDMKRRLVFSTGLRLCLLTFITGVHLSPVLAANEEEDNGYTQISIFAKAVQLIRQDYVDGNKISYHDLITAAMKGMLSSL